MKQMWIRVYADTVMINSRTIISLAIYVVTGRPNVAIISIVTIVSMATGGMNTYIACTEYVTREILKTFN